jgi:hypothetical protein
MTQPSTCSESASTEPLAGTAPLRKVWFIIEQPGAWGNQALTDSNLPEGFGEDLLNTITDPTIGVAVARRPDLANHERRTTRRRRLWLAHTSPGGVRMRAGSLDDIRDVLKWDWAAITRGELPPVGRRSADPVLFVCTNGKRDLCCALHAREIVDQLRPDPELTGQIYEISHLGGHRFAPTALLLPTGYMYGRLSVESTREVLSSAWNGQVLPDLLRGRTSLADWAQVAEIAVRKQFNVLGIENLDVVVIRNTKAISSSTVHELKPEEIVQVRHQDGRTWQVNLNQEEIQARQISCGAEAEIGSIWRSNSIESLKNWS